MTPVLLPASITHADCWTLQKSEECDEQSIKMCR
jgi:hypothetical protein